MKPRIVLSAIALFAVIGGTLAFKAARFNSTPAFTLTTVYVSNGISYTKGGATFVAPHTTVFLTPTLPGIASTVLTTSGTTTTAPVVLTRVGGTQTIAFPAWTATTKSTLVTNIQ